MKLYIRQRMFSIKNKSDVYDENQVPLYYVEGKVFTLTHDLQIIDVRNGNEVAFIRSKVFRFLPEFVISRPGYEDVIFKKEFTFFRPSYQIIGSNWRLEGDFFGHDYQIVDGSNRPIMTLSKRWFTWADTYEINVLNDEDDVLALCIALCVDIVLDAESTSANAAAAN